jgi:hypothetical protein
VLVWKADTRPMNPTVDEQVIAEGGVHLDGDPVGQRD